jgi:hypothetical protein
VIPEIDIWRAAQLMLKRYGEKAIWRRIMAAVTELANKIPQARSTKRSNRIKNGRPGLPSLYS